jgi:hypothetical protein
MVMIKMSQSIEIVPQPRGRRTELTVRTFLRIIKLIEAGWSVSDGCRSEGLSYRRFRQLCQYRPNFQRRYEKAVAVRQDLWHDRAIGSIMEAGEKSWMAHAWFLERVWPERYALKAVERTEVPATMVQEAQIRILTLPDEDFDDLQKEPGFTTLPDGGLETMDGTVKIQVYRQEHNERLLG